MTTRKPGRLPDLLPHVSVKRIVDWGADAVKILIYYSPFDDAQVNDIKHAFIERIGAECETNKIPFFLEFVGYDPKGGDEKGLEYARSEAGDCYQEHGGVLQAAISSGRAESGSSDQRASSSKAAASTRGRKPTAREEALDAFPRGRRYRGEAVHLSERGREQRAVRGRVEHGVRSGYGLFRACCAAALPGRKASRFTPSRA